MSNAITFRMNASIAGEVTRFDTYGATITSEKVASATAATGAALATPTWAYGQVVVVDSTGARPIVAGDTAFLINQMGFLVRPFPSTDLGVGFPASTVAFGGGAPPTSGVCSVLRRGYIGAKLNGATAGAKGLGVYYYAAATTSGHVQGGVEAASGGNLVLMTPAFWQGAADSGSNSELAYNL